MPVGVMEIDEVDPDPFYTKTCSQATLQSHKKGFFLEYVNNVTSLVGEKWINKTFSLLKTDKERIEICFSEDKIKAAVFGTMKYVSPLYRGKCITTAQKCLAEGNKELSKGQPLKAMQLFTQGVLRAPSKGSDPSNILSLCLSARSESLLELQKYSECIADIQLSIKEGFPEELRYQLYWRMAVCHRHTGEISKARICLQLALKLLGSSENVKHEAIIISELKSLAGKEDKKNHKSPEKMKEVNLVKEPNPNIVGVSSLLKVTQSKSKGRFMAASGAISPGDILVVEEPFCACLLPEMAGTHCHHCFKRLEFGAIGCNKCSGVAFCSVSCRDIACTSYHEHECRYLGLLVGSGMSILCHIALRMITQQKERAPFFLRIAKHIYNNDMSLNDMNKNSQQYVNVIHLEAHERKRSAEDFFQRTLMAIFLLRCLQDGGTFFPDLGVSEDHASQDEILIGSFILRHLQLLQFNAHEIFETCLRSDMALAAAKTLYIGVGIYSNAALFNHDCYPALARYYNGKRIILQALRPLKSGDEVPENYGPIYTKKNYQMRQRSLSSRYWFKCHCEACREKWPLLEEINCNEPQFMKCENRSFEELKLNIQQLTTNLFDRGIELMDSGNTKKASKLFEKYIIDLHSLGVQYPHRESQLAMDALRICLSDQGNKWVLD